MLADGTRGRRPGGVDKGKGGKYAILPRATARRRPRCYIGLRSSTYRGFALLRSNLDSGSDADIAKAVEFGRRVKLYPLAQAASPPETKFVDAIDTEFDATIRYDHRFFQSLNRIVQNEPWLDRDRAMIDPLKSLGIEKGKPFKPDIRMQELLNEAARDAHAWLDCRIRMPLLEFVRTRRALDASFLEGAGRRHTVRLRQQG